MTYFDDEFRDFPDYIYRITERIWEGRNVGAINRYYAPDCILRTPGFLGTTAKEVVQGTLETLHMFPDRRLLGEDVIWCETPTGLLSSHRIASPCTHLGDGAFGPATGKSLVMRTIADCAVKDNQVFEEWLVRDQAGIVRQIGHDPREYVFAKVEADLEAGRSPRFYTPAIDKPGTYRRPESWASAGDIYVQMLKSVWDDKDVSAIHKTYNEGVNLALPGSVDDFGKAAADRFWLGYLASFPDAAFSLDHMIVRDDPGRPIRCAARWSIQGKHQGHGTFGPPSGAEIYIMGISHAEIIDGTITREWIMTDELAIWTQIAMKQG